MNQSFNLITSDELLVITGSVTVTENGNDLSIPLPLEP